MCPCLREIALAAAEDGHPGFLGHEPLIRVRVRVRARASVKARVRARARGRGRGRVRVRVRDCVLEVGGSFRCRS